MNTLDLPKQTPTGTHHAPPGIAPLEFIPAYTELSPAHRVRYNQLFGVYLNEQTAFFEEQIAESLLPPLIKDKKIPGELRANLQEFLDDERRHSQMFRSLNTSLDPELYPPGWNGYRFVKPKPAALRNLRATASRPRTFPFWIWIMLVQEESSLHFGRRVLHHREALDPEVVKTHRIHLADEAAHVAWDLELIETLWAKSSRTKRSFNARILRYVMREFFTSPRRANLEVARQLATEFPELSPRLPKWQHQLVLRNT